MNGNHGEKRERERRRSWTWPPEACLCNATHDDADSFGDLVPRHAYTGKREKRLSSGREQYPGEGSGPNVSLTLHQLHHFPRVELAIPEEAVPLRKEPREQQVQSTGKVSAKKTTPPRGLPFPPTPTKKSP